MNLAETFDELCEICNKLLALLKEDIRAAEIEAEYEKWKRDITL